MDYMERAYDDAKYGHYSHRPYIDMVIPSLTDPTVAPPGKHVLSCFVQYAPYKLAEGAWDERSEEHTSELQSRLHLVCRLLLEKKKKNISTITTVTYIYTTYSYRRTPLSVDYLHT